MNAGITSGHLRGGVQDDEGVWRNPRNEFLEVHIGSEERSRNSVQRLSRPGLLKIVFWLQRTCCWQLVMKGLVAAGLGSHVRG